MSFLNTPGTDGYNSVTREEAVNLLLTSIAQEEAGLSKLMDAERNKVLYTINRYRHGRCDLKNVLEINKSVDSTIKNMIKYQMLLQHKLENIKELLASYPAESKPPVNAAQTRRGTAAAKCKPSAGPASTNSRPSLENAASKKGETARSANAGPAPMRPPQKCTAAAHSRPGTAAAKCRHSSPTGSKADSPPGNSVSAGTETAHSSGAGSAPKHAHRKCTAHSEPNQPGQKSSEQKVQHPEPKSSAPNDSEIIKKKCGRGRCSSDHNPVMNSAYHAARKKTANRQAAMLRALLFCFLPFRLF
jgi:hypothetical protein